LCEVMLGMEILAQIVKLVQLTMDMLMLRLKLGINLVSHFS
jgi:hypothetical protein